MTWETLSITATPTPRRVIPSMLAVKVVPVGSLYERKDRLELFSKIHLNLTFSLLRDS